MCFTLLPSHTQLSDSRLHLWFSCVLHHSTRLPTLSPAPGVLSRAFFICLLHTQTHTHTHSHSSFILSLCRPAFRSLFCFIFLSLAPEGRPSSLCARLLVCSRQRSARSRRLSRRPSPVRCCTALLCTAFCKREMCVCVCAYVCFEIALTSCCFEPPHDFRRPSGSQLGRQVHHFHQWHCSCRCSDG